MNMKENKGFTLVELIVVIAILGILAAVAVPAYTGYINRAKDADILSDLTAISTAAQAASVENIATTGQVTLTTIEVSNAGAITVTPAVDTNAFNIYYKGAAGSTMPTADCASKLSGSAKYKNGAKWTSAAGWQGK